MRPFVFLLFCLVSLGCSAQVKFKTGMQFNDEEYNSLPMQSRFSGSKYSELPLVVSLRRYCPYAGDQGSHGTCVGWATCYSALTAYYAIRSNCTDRKKITENAFSSLFLYNQVMEKEQDCDQGTRIPLALTKLEETGSCYDRDFIRNDCSVLPPDSLKRSARPFAIQDFIGLYSTTEEDRVKIDKTRRSLAEHKPVVVGLRLMMNFMDVSREDPVWHPDKGNTTAAGGHAMCVIGYDEGKEMFEVMNSFGAAWGDSGFCYITYSDYAKYATYGFQLLLKPDKESELKPVGGSFTFQHLTDRNALTFTPVNTVLIAKGYYALEKKDWKEGDLFQLVARNTHPDEYVYVFSIDPKKTWHLHFPRMEDTGQESPLVSASNTSVIIPGPESALAIAQAGTEHLVVLFSRKKIDNIGEIMDQLKTVPPNQLFAELKKLLGSRLAPPEDVSYEGGNMSFTGSLKPADIVPLVLVVQSK
jgi:hypothetical protein